MSVTSEERLEIERAFRDRMMSDIANGDFQIHGMKWDTILAGIRNLDQLGPRSTTEQRIEEIVRLRAAEAERDRYRFALMSASAVAGRFMQRGPAGFEYEEISQELAVTLRIAALALER